MSYTYKERSPAGKTASRKAGIPRRTARRNDLLFPQPGTRALSPQRSDRASAHAAQRTPFRTCSLKFIILTRSCQRCACCICRFLRFPENCSSEALVFSDESRHKHSKNLKSEQSLWYTVFLKDAIKPAKNDRSPRFDRP